MNTMKEFGAVPLQKIHTAAEGAGTEIGDLTASPAHHLQGRVVLSDTKTCAGQDPGCS